MAVGAVDNNRPTTSANSQNLADYGFDFKMKDGKIEITNTGNAPLSLGATAGSGQADLGSKPPLNQPIPVGKTVSIDVPDGWNGNFYRKTDAPDGKPSKEHPANMLEVSKTGGHLWWDTTAIDGVNTAMSGTNAQGKKIGIDQASFKQLVSEAGAAGDLITDKSGNATAVKAPTIGDVSDGRMSAAEIAQNGYQTADWYGHSTYIKDPQLEKLYRAHFQSTYILPDDDRMAMNAD